MWLLEIDMNIQVILLFCYIQVCSFSITSISKRDCSGVYDRYQAFAKQNLHDISWPMREGPVSLYVLA